jgi:hypothetical protein
MPPVSKPAATMSFGQMTEVVFMLLMPLFFAVLGVKWMLLVGMFAWVVRYGLFAAAADDGVMWMVFGGILLHGICYDFFFVTGFIYVDQRASQKIRGQAQGLLVLITQGLGMLIGAQLIGRLVNMNAAEDLEALTDKAAALRDQAAEVAAPQAAELQAQASDLLLSGHDWQTIWLVPCLMAAVIAVAFLFLFRKDQKPVSPPEDETPAQ